MKSLKYAAIMVLLVGAPVLADSMVAYSIDVGGDNNSATYEAGGLYPPFTTSSQYTYNVGDVVTWDVSVAVSGTHNNSGGAGHDLAPLGAANLVANLTLYFDANENGVAEVGEEVLVGAAPISCATGVPADGSATTCEPTAAGFFSSINDGDTDGSRNDGLAVAAYAAGFDADDNGSKHGTIVSAVADDGPNFDFAFLPSANGLAGKRADQIGTTPVYAANVDLSEMVGIGAGIKEFDFAPIGHLPGVGMTGTLGIYDNDCDTSFARGGLGTGPVFEGQIATDGLDPGSYILVVEPGQGNNIIHGDIYCADSGGDPYYGNYSDTFGTFAAEANITDGGEITFVLEESLIEVEILSWESVRTHGALGPMPIVLNPTATGSSVPAPTVESRLSGVQRIEVALDTAITLGDVTEPIVATDRNGVSPAATATVSLESGGTVLVLAFAVGAIPDTSCYTIDLSGNLPLKAGTDPDVEFRSVSGDGNNTGGVDIGDIAAPNSFRLTGAPVGATNFRFDYNLTGAFDIGDIAFANSGRLAGKSASCP